jgi:hypothetical protein
MGGGVERGGQKNDGDGDITMQSSSASFEGLQHGTT